MLIKAVPSRPLGRRIKEILHGHIVWNGKMKKNQDCDDVWKMEIISSDMEKNLLHVQVQIHTDYGAACSHCYIEAKLSDTDSCIYNEYGSTTSADGIVHLIFKSDTRVKAMTISFAVTSIHNAYNVIPKDHCVYSASKTFKRANLLNYICQKEYTDVATIPVRFDVAESEKALESEKAKCDSFDGSGMWATGIKPYSDVVDKYIWKQEGCRIPHITVSEFMNNLKLGTKIAFIGDSILGNIYTDFKLFLNDEKSNLYLRNSGTGMTFDRSIEFNYFKTYGYYKFNGQCCGESDCLVRQRARKGNYGFEKLQKMKAYLEGNAQCTIIIKSPVVHHSRAYVTEKQHMETINNIISELTKFKSCRIIWVSATPMGTHMFDKNKFLDNRSDRRWKLHVKEKQMVTQENNIIFMDVWSMFWTRKDRFYDVTHVYPVTPRIIPSTVTAMLKLIIPPTSRNRTANVQRPPETARISGSMFKRM